MTRTKGETETLRDCGSFPCETTRQLLTQNMCDYLRGPGSKQYCPSFAVFFANTHVEQFDAEVNALGDGLDALKYGMVEIGGLEDTENLQDSNVKT